MFGMNMDMTEISQVQNQVTQMCKEHIACEGCPLLKEQLQIGNSVIICENTGRKDK